MSYSEPQGLHRSPYSHQSHSEQFQVHQLIHDFNLAHCQNKTQHFILPICNAKRFKFSLQVTHICFQQVVHGALRHLFRLMELLQGLPDLFILDFTLAFLFVVIVQAAALQLL